MNAVICRMAFEIDKLEIFICYPLRCLGGFAALREICKYALNTRIDRFDLNVCIITVDFQEMDVTFLLRIYMSRNPVRIDCVFWQAA